jgi:hypothetical protein
MHAIYLAHLILFNLKKFIRLILSDRVVKLTTHFHLVPNSRKVELYLHSRICIHGIVLS